jgi:hypothetical protein
MQHDKFFCKNVVAQDSAAWLNILKTKWLRARTTKEAAVPVPSAHQFKL